MIIILTLRNDIRNIEGGSSIRIKGYTKYLKNFGIKYKFVAPLIPSYVDEKDFISMKISRSILFLVHIYNLIYFFPVISTFIKNIVLKNKNIKKLVEISKDRYIWSHQNSLISLFLKLTVKQEFIHDIHGIFILQKEYIRDYSLKQKILFLLNIRYEKLILKKADIVNVNSLRMKEYITKTFKRTKGIVIAKDGILRSDFKKKITQGEISNLRDKYGLGKKDRVLFFAGNFKRIGGIHHLVDVFCELSKEFTNLKLFLIGNGHMGKRIFTKIRKFKQEKNVIHLKHIEYSEIFKFQQLSTLIICPDIKNKYNELVPHIKLYDSLASKKPVLSSRFDVLIESFPESKKCIFYFEPSNLNDMKLKIIKVLNSLDEFKPLSNRELQKSTYRKRVEGVIEQYEQIGII